jgi:hypothetical protein
MTARWWIAIAVVVALTVAGEVAFHDAAHALHWWHELPGFDLVYGLVGCLAIIVVSKALGKVWLQRPEDYYDGGETARRDGA